MESTATYIWPKLSFRLENIGCELTWRGVGFTWSNCPTYTDGTDQVHNCKATIHQKPVKIQFITLKISINSTWVWTFFNRFHTLQSRNAIKSKRVTGYERISNFNNEREVKRVIIMLNFNTNKSLICIYKDQFNLAKKYMYRLTCENKTFYSSHISVESLSKNYPAMYQLISSSDNISIF